MKAKRTKKKGMAFVTIRVVRLSRPGIRRNAGAAPILSHAQCSSAVHGGGGLRLHDARRERYVSCAYLLRFLALLDDLVSA